MKAALVHSFDQVPRFGEVEAPTPAEGQVLVDVLAAAATPLVKGQASGSHYSSVAEFPLIPGNDGVGKLADGRLVYFFVANTRQGSMAEQTVARGGALVPLPQGLDPIKAAVLANPGMSSWAALSSRAKLQKGETVMIHGATGSAGRMAIQIAKILGAGRVIAVGRNDLALEALKEIGADETFSLNRAPDVITRELKEEVLPRGVDVVLDYLWGSPSERLLGAFIGHGNPEGEPRCRFVEIGSVAGQTISLPGSTLRASGLELMGSGLGSVPHRELLAGIAGVFQAALTTDFRVEAAPTPLEDVEGAWNRDFGDRRLVLLPR